MENLESTKQEILEAIHTFAGSVDQRFDQVDKRFDRLETEIGSMEQEMGSMKQRIGSIEARMVTKDYLDDKIADWRGDLVGMVRKCDKKDSALVGSLRAKKIISKGEADDILAMSPFPR